MVTHSRRKHSGIIPVKLFVSAPQFACTVSGATSPIGSYIPLTWDRTILLVNTSEILAGISCQDRRGFVCTFLFFLEKLSFTRKRSAFLKAHSTPYRKSTTVENLVNLLSFFYGSSAFGNVVRGAVAKDSLAGTCEHVSTHLCRLAECRCCHGARRTVSHVNGRHHVSARLPSLIQVSPQEPMGHLIE